MLYLTSFITASIYYFILLLLNIEVMNHLLYIFLHNKFPSSLTSNIYSPRPQYLVFALQLANYEINSVVQTQYLYFQRLDKEYNALPTVTIEIVFSI